MMALTCHPAPVSLDQFAPAWLQLGLAGRWDEGNFPSEETFTILQSHETKLQLLEGKHTGEPSAGQDPRTKEKPIKPAGEV